MGTDTEQVTFELALERVNLAVGDELTMIALAQSTLEYRVHTMGEPNVVVRAAIEHRDREIARLRATVAQLESKVIAFNRLVEIAHEQRGDGSECAVDLEPESAPEALLCQEIDRLHRQLCLCGAGDEKPELPLHELLHTRDCPLDGLWSYG